MKFRSPSEQFIKPGGDGSVDRLVHAFAAAWALIGCADGDLDRLEMARFLEAAANQPALAEVTPETLTGRLTASAEDVLRGGPKGHQQALDMISAIANDPQAVAVVVAAARAALVANREIKPVEESALNNIANALGVDPATI